MSRLLGIISAGTSPFDSRLLSAPRTLPSLSMVQPDGWGAAVFDDGKWEIETRPRRAATSARATPTSLHQRGVVLVAHISERTEAALDVTPQPLRRGSWVFAHDGAVEKPHFLAARMPADRMGDVEARTGGAVLFAYLLAQLDRAGASDGAADAIVSNVVAELAEHQVSSASFLLSNGVVMYAHRLGRPLAFLEEDRPTPTMTVASEPLTDEPWCPLEPSTLLRCERRKQLEVTFLRGADPRRPRKSDIELPFTD